MNPIVTGPCHIVISGSLSNYPDWEKLFLDEVRVCCNIQTQPETVVDYISSKESARFLDNQINSVSKMFAFNLSQLDEPIKIEEDNLDISYNLCIINGRIASARSMNKSWEDNPNLQFSFDLTKHSSLKIITNLMEILDSSNEGKIYLQVSTSRPVFLHIGQDSMYEIPFDNKLHPAYIARSTIFFRRKCDGYRSEQNAIIQKYREMDRANVAENIQDDEKRFSEISSGKDRFIIQSEIHTNLIMPMRTDIDFNFDPLVDDCRICFDRIGYVEIKILGNTHRIKTVGLTKYELKQQILNLKGLLYDRRFDN